MQTLLLDQTTWDLVLDASGNIAVASEPYALAQDAASAIRTFLGEVWYDTSLGVPYFPSAPNGSAILGQIPPVSMMKAAFVKAAMTVPDVIAAQVFLVGVGTNRQLTGQVQVTNVNGVISAIGF